MEMNVATCHDCRNITQCEMAVYRNEGEFPLCPPCLAARGPDTQERADALHVKQVLQDCGVEPERYQTEYYPHLLMQLIGSGKVRVDKRGQPQVIRPGVSHVEKITFKHNGDAAVDHPAHYGGADDPYEHVKVAEAWGLDKDAHLYNCTKYICRAGLKGGDNTRLQDLKKARWYLERRIQNLEKEDK